MEASQKSKSAKRYPPELKQRAVRMVLEAREHDPQDQGCIARIARQLGVGDQSLRNWVNQAETDLPGTTSCFIRNAGIENE